MRKAFITAMLLCISVSCLTSCQNLVPPQNPTINIDEKAAETITLSMFSPVSQSPETSDSFRDLTLKYNKLQSHVQISFDGVSTADGYDDFLEERLDADNMVDIFFVNAENVKEIAEKGQFYDLSGMESFQKLTKTAKEQAMIGDVAYTIPLDMAAYVMAVNVSLLERNDLEIPQNYEEFLHCCKMLKDQGITPIAINRWFAMTAPVMANSLYPVYQAENREEVIAGLNSGDIKIGDYMINGFRMFDLFLKEGYYGDNLTVDDVDAIKAGTHDLEDFVNGRAAFYIVAAKNLQPVAMENGDESILIGIPLLPDGMITLPSIASRFCINANSNYLEESVAFGDFVTSERITVMEQAATGKLSPFHSAASIELDIPWKQDILDLMESGHQIPIEDMNVHFGYWDNTRKLCLSMIGGMSPEEAAEEFNRLQMEGIQSYGQRTEGN